MKTTKMFFGLLFALLYCSCGTIENVPAEGAGTDPAPDANPDESPGIESIFLFGTDYISSGQLMTADISSPGELSNTGVTGLGSSAVIRLYNGLLYILHDGFSAGSSDNVQIIDPSASFQTAGQYSTGNGTNPHDIVVVGEHAYISLYSPERDATSASVDEAGRPADVIVMNLSSGEIEKRLSFFDYLNDDGSRTARADQMALAGDKLYVCLQDLEGLAFSQNAPGKIGIVDVTTNEVEGVITLQGRNPVDIVYSEDGNKLFVSLQASYDFAMGNFDTTAPYGGIEIVSLDNPGSSVLLADEELGGYAERLTLSDDFLLVVASRMDPATFSFSSDIIKMSKDNELTGGVSVFVSGSSDVREIAVDSQDRLWVSRRTISAESGTASDPHVDVIDLATGEAVGSPMEPPVPVTSIAIGNM